MYQMTGLLRAGNELLFDGVEVFPVNYSGILHRERYEYYMMRHGGRRSIWLKMILSMAFIQLGNQLSNDNTIGEVSGRLTGRYFLCPACFSILSSI